jgi:hypothetical protein
MKLITNQLRTRMKSKKINRPVLYVDIVGKETLDGNPTELPADVGQEKTTVINIKNTDNEPEIRVQNQTDCKTV